MVMEKSVTDKSLGQLLPLENGDFLTRQEFERRYQAMPNVKKAELIEGVVYMASPLRFEPHAEPHAKLITWLGVYYSATPGVRFGIEPTVRLDMENEPQPDGVLLLHENCGGQSRISNDGYVEGAPELIAEIAASSASYDLREKLRVYRRNQVQEYLVWQIYEKKMNWFRLKGGEYITLTPDDDRIIRSEVFPGLWLAIDALLSGQLAKVLAVLQEGIVSVEHANFVTNLRM
jgi:Uma2 family endonuclease